MDISVCRAATSSAGFAKEGDSFKMEVVMLFYYTFLSVGIMMVVSCVGMHTQWGQYIAKSIISHMVGKFYLVFLFTALDIYK